ncbi:MAG: Bug family tripartite tricarboxylate transporter substrate binding protein [Gemmatimonadales bacterium]
MAVPRNRWASTKADLACSTQTEETMISSLQWRAAALLVLGVIASTALPPALAQTYPTKPVQLVVAFPPGGVGDIVARAVSDKLARALGQPVNVENRPGSAGLIGTQSVMRAAPDGYTLLAGQTTEIVVNRALGAELPGEPEKPLKPIALFAVMPLVLAVPAGAPYASPDDLIKAAGASRRGLSFGSGGPGTPGHLAAELLRARTKSRFTHVPFDGGGPALEGLLQQRVDFYFPVLVTAMPQIKSGQLKALAITSGKRSPVLPDVPTLAEAGVKDIEVTHWVGLFAPGETPSDIADKLNQAVTQALSDPEVKERLASSGAEITPMSAEQFAKFLQSETDKYTTLIRTEFCSNLWYGGCGGFDWR